MLRPYASLEVSATSDGDEFSDKRISWREPPDDTHPLALISRVIDQCVERSSVKASSNRRIETDLDPRLLRAALLQSLYSFGHNQLLLDHLRYNILFRWFVGLADDEEPWTVPSYTKALTRLLTSAEGTRVLREVRHRTKAGIERVKHRFRVNDELIREWLAGADQGDDGVEQQLSDWRLDKARDIIRRRITDEALTPESIAGEMCMSRRSFFLLFNKHGLTPTRLIRDMRLDRCRAMLTDPAFQNRKILDIAVDSGFAVPATFSRCFKERFGITPNEVRSAASATGPTIHSLKGLGHFAALPDVDWNLAKHSVGSRSWCRPMEAHA